MFDVNLRHPHFERDVVEKLLYQADIVKLNEEELEIISRWNGFSVTSLDVTSHKIKEKYKIDQIIVTLGENGALISYGSDILRHPGYKVEVEDTVGSGDAFLAAFLANQIKGRNVNTCLDFACATGAYVATQNGANPPYDESLIVNFIKKQTYGRITTKLAMPG